MKFCASAFLILAAAATSTHGFVVPSTRSSHHLVLLHQMPDQNAGWMTDGALSGESLRGNPQSGTYTRPNTNFPSTEPGMPLTERRSGRSYYPRKQQQQPAEPGMGLGTELQWWERTGSPADTPFIGGNRHGVSDQVNYYTTPRRGEGRQTDPPSYPETVQGAGSRRTWDTSQHDQTNFVVGSSSGRPVYSDVQIWEGPNNTPASMRLYSEDGSMRPWSAGFQNTFRSGGSSAVNIRNTGPMEFPLIATVEGSYDGSRGQPVGQQIKEEEKQKAKYTSIVKSQTIQGESLKTFSVGSDVQAIRIELFSEGRPMYAQVEMWQGPNNVQQCAEIYSDNGNDRVWSAVIPTPGYSSTIAIRNTGPMAYPIEASVDAIS